MLADQVPLIVMVFAFLSIGGIVVVVGRVLAEEATIQRRLSSKSGAGEIGVSTGSNDTFLGSLYGRIDEKRFGIEGTLKSKLRRDLIRAGYFSEHAIQSYVIARLGLVVVLPILSFVAIKIFSPTLNYYIQLLVLCVAALVGIIGVDVYLARRRRALQHENRSIFPDLVDMLVVCVDAGLGLDAAFARIAPEIQRRSRILGTNLHLLGAETRAGRTTPEALGSLADRLNLDEVRTFATMLRQSVELGTDVADALRAFSDEMRAKRLLRAEELANKLPVKMVLPLGACIFPVILMVVMVPVVIRLLSIFHR